MTVDDMKSKAEQAKGHVKEAVGELTDDDKLRAEGKADRASGKVKGMAEHAKDAVEDKVDELRAKAQEKIDRR
jgi:uncharacterized protein YjbJ (UPF0337 family)